MRFCGVELAQVHPAIRIAKEIPPGMQEREIETIAGSEGETAAGYTVRRGEYTVRVGIACRTRLEAWRVRALLAAWATASGQPQWRTWWPLQRITPSTSRQSPPWSASPVQSRWAPIPTAEPL